MKKPTNPSIAIFGGAFDPPHNGHLMILEHLLTNPEITQIIVIPTHIPPHKSTPKATPQQRKAMTELLVTSATQTTRSTTPIEVLDIELNAPETSYTYLTLQSLQNTYPEATFKLAMGEDSYRSLHTWKKPALILDLAQLYVISRDTHSTDSITPQRYFEHHFPNHSFETHLQYYQTPLIPASSTQLRQGQANNGTYKHCPKVIQDYITQEGLYQ